MTPASTTSLRRFQTSQVNELIPLIISLRPCWTLTRGPGIYSTEISLASQLVTTTGTAPPSAIISSIQSTGRPAILRGSGASNGTTPGTFLPLLLLKDFELTSNRRFDIDAAVCILEIPVAHAPSSSDPSSSPVRGLARLITLSPKITLLDLSLSGLPPGTYEATLRTTGDISLGAASIGKVWRGEEGDKEGLLGNVVIDHEGKGSVVGEVGWRVVDMVGRGVLVQKAGGTDRAQPRREDTVVGVVARSAGIWENEKMVCACSGKTVWEERTEMMSKGIV